MSSTEFRGSVDTFGITQKLGSIGQEALVGVQKNMNNVVNEIVGSDDSDLDDHDLDSSSEEDVATDLKNKLKNAKKMMAFEPTQLLHPVLDNKKPAAQ